jgi:ABC-type uncharacterized transport system substrate-binding protein
MLRHTASKSRRRRRPWGSRVIVLAADGADQLEPAFALGHQQGMGAVLVGDDPLFDTRTEQLVEAAARYAIPTMSYLRDFAVGGGLLSYGPNYADMAHQAGAYAGRILKGEKTADLPIVQPTKFELVVNLRTAKTLGLTVPPALLSRADEVIE